MPEKHHLRANPFRENRHDHGMVGRIEEFKKIATIVEDAVENRMPAIVAVLGPYGMGKTFTFYQLRQELKGHFKFFTKVRKIQTAMATATRESFPSKYAQYIYTSVIDDIGEGGFTYLRKQLDATGRPAEQVLAKLKEKNFRAAFINLDNEDNRATAWGWMRGEKIPQKRLDPIGISSRISEENEAHRHLLDLLRMFRCVGYDGFVLLLDELEAAYAQGKAFTKILTWVRQWYDSVGRLMSETPDDAVPAIMCLGCAPETWNRIKEEAEEGKIKGTRGDLRAFLDRIPPENEVELKALKPQEVKDLISEFLSKAHAPGFKPTHPLYPFEEKSANDVYEVSQGVPRFAIRTSRILLREADEEGKLIDRNNTDRWLRKANISE
jgi:hypothetical protein